MYRKAKGIESGAIFFLETLCYVRYSRRAIAPPRFSREILFSFMRKPDAKPVPDKSLNGKTDVSDLLNVAAQALPQLVSDKPSKQFKGWDVDPPSKFDEFLDRAEEVFRSAPSVESICFNNFAGTTMGWGLDAKRLADCPQLLEAPAISRSCEMERSGGREGTEIVGEGHPLAGGRFQSFLSRAGSISGAHISASWKAWRHRLSLPDRPADAPFAAPAKRFYGPCMRIAGILPALFK